MFYSYRLITHNFNLLYFCSNQTSLKGIRDSRMIYSSNSMRDTLSVFIISLLWHKQTEWWILPECQQFRPFIDDHPFISIAH